MTQNLTDPKTKKRETEGLLEAMRIHQLKSGLILTAEEEGTYKVDVDGKKVEIVVLPVWKWLLNSDCCCKQQ